MKFIPVIFLLLVCSFGKLDRIFLKKNGSFSPKFILPNWKYCPQLDTLEKEGIEEILNQPFTYLTKGKQSFIFLSQDQKWVLKLIRLPGYAMRFRIRGKKQGLLFLTKTLQGCKQAYEELEEETCVIYAHLKPSAIFSKNIELKDLFQRSHWIDPNTIPFIVQRYGSSFFSAFDQSQDRKFLIEQTMNLFSRLYEKGFIDRDPILDKNFGIMESTPFLIDIGQIEKMEKLPPKSQFLEEMTQSLKGKLERESPELLSYYKKFLQ